MLHSDYDDERRKAVENILETKCLFARGPHDICWSEVWRLNSVVDKANRW